MLLHAYKIIFRTLIVTDLRSQWGSVGFQPTLDESNHGSPIAHIARIARIAQSSFHAMDSILSFFLLFFFNKYKRLPQLSLLRKKTFCAAGLFLTGYLLFYAVYIGLHKIHRAMCAICAMCAMCADY